MSGTSVTFTSGRPYQRVYMATMEPWSEYWWLLSLPKEAGTGGSYCQMRSCPCCGKPSLLKIIAHLMHTLGKNKGRQKGGSMQVQARSHDETHARWNVCVWLLLSLTCCLHYTVTTCSQILWHLDFWKTKLTFCLLPVTVSLFDSDDNWCRVDISIRTKINSRNTQ